MNTLKYRPEIDGLRSVAVLAVVLYHAGFALFGGGYVGVDVFLVISGYLITNLIVREVRQTGGFQFGQFYLRRLRRLFPALLCTTIVSSVLAFLLFSPSALEEYAESAIAGLLSISNFYFWQQADYFDAAAITKPLLHTWSLSVEEQFYLIWPAVVVFVLAKARTMTALAAIALIGAASLWLAEYWLAADRDAAFYLLPARIVELGIGASLVWVEALVFGGKRKPTNAMLEVGSIAGLALIVWSIATYNHSTPFPGVTSLWPCIGTALFILCSQARYGGAILRLQPAVFIGKISYSLYLVHWPIIVFYTHAIQREPNTAGQFLIVLLSLVLGWMQYQYIENRFRHAQPGTGFAFAKRAGLAAAAVMMLSAWAALDKGLEWRIPEDRKVKTDFELRAQMKRDYCSSPAPEGSFAAANADIITCQNYRGKQNDIYVWGDSHALHLAAGFASTYSAYNVYVLYMNGCDPQSGFGNYVRKIGLDATKACVKRNRKTIEAFSNENATNVVFTSAKRSNPRRIAAASKEILDSLNKAGHRVAFVADFIRPGRSLANCRNVPDYMVSDSDLQLGCTGVTQASLRELRYNRSLKRQLPELVQVNDLQCAHESCKFYHRGKLLYRDAHHLNIDGSKYFVRKLKPRLPIMKDSAAKKLKRQAESASLKQTAQQEVVQ